MFPQHIVLVHSPGSYTSLGFRFLRPEVRCGVFKPVELSSCPARGRRPGLFVALLAGLLVETEVTELARESFRVSSCPAYAEARVFRFTGLLAEAEVEIKESTPEDALVWRRVSVATERAGRPEARVFLLLIALLTGSEVEAADFAFADALVWR